MNWRNTLILAIVALAGIAYFMNGDNIGASGILVGAAAIIAIVTGFGADRDEARDEG